MDAFIARGMLHVLGCPYDDAPLDVDALIVSIPGTGVHLLPNRTKQITSRSGGTNQRVWLALYLHPLFAEGRDVLVEFSHFEYTEGRRHRAAGGVVTVRQAAQAPAAGRIAMCTMLRYDQGLLRLWTSHWAALGVTDFYIYYNHENTSSLGGFMRKLEGLPVRVTFLQYPYAFYVPLPGESFTMERFKQHHSQLVALTSCLYRFHQRHDFMLFLDVDELLVLQHSRTLPALIQRLPPLWTVVSFHMAWAKLQLPPDADEEDVGLQQLAAGTVLRLPPVAGPCDVKFIVRTAALGEKAAAKRDNIPFLVTPHFVAGAEDNSFVLPAEHGHFLHLRNRRHGSREEDRLVEDSPDALVDTRVGPLVRSSERWQRMQEQTSESTLLAR
jgi:hypothetical protein